MKDLAEIIPHLKAWFPPEAHRDRDLPGGGKWFFIPWQQIRERLDEVCPEWQVSYSAPQYIGDYCTVTCTITITGISRQGIGNAEIEVLSKRGKDMSRGTPIERAVADAFKTAAEAWGVARYLDEQADDQTREAFVRYMHGKGDGRAALNYHRNEGSLPATAQASRKADVSKPFGQPDRPSKPAATTRPAARPTAAPSKSANLTRLRSITKQLGYSEIAGDKQIQQAIALNCPGKKSADLDAVQVNRVIDSLLIFWAEQRGAGSVEKLDGLYAREISGNEARASLNDADLIRAWQAIAFPSSVRA